MQLLIKAAALTALMVCSTGDAAQAAEAPLATLNGAPLSPDKAEVAARWLANHKHGWGLNFAPPPVGQATIILRTPSGPVSLTYFPGPGVPGWRHVVILEKPRSSGVAQFSDADLQPLFDLARS